MAVIVIGAVGGFLLLLILAYLVHLVFFRRRSIIRAPAADLEPPVAALAFVSESADPEDPGKDADVPAAAPSHGCPSAPLPDGLVASDLGPPSVEILVGLGDGSEWRDDAGHPAAQLHPRSRVGDTGPERPGPAEAAAEAGEAEEAGEAAAGVAAASYEEVMAATLGLDASLIIGRGGFGAVYGCAWRGREVAIKVLDAHSMQGEEELAREVRIPPPPAARRRRASVLAFDPRADRV